MWRASRGKAKLTNAQQTVGQGIVCHLSSTSGTGPRSVAEWSEWAKRCLLYRAEPKLEEPWGCSGMALYVEQDDSAAGGLGGEAARAAVVGFQSFVVDSGYNMLFDLEGDSLDKRMRRGEVSFYGAFEIPDDLRNKFLIK